MRTRIATLLLLCALFLCTSANAGKQNREVGTFRKIQISGGIDVYFTQENTQSIRVETENVDEDDVVTEVKSNTLIVKMKDSYKWGNLKLKKRVIKVYVFAPALEGLSMSGGSDFYAEHLKSPDFSISTSGGSDVNIVNMAVDGKISIATSGGSDCNIKNLKTPTCRIASSGGSDVKIGLEVSGELTVATSGGSDVKLSGTAAKVSIAASGSSDVYVRDLKYEQIDSKVSGGADVHK